MFTYMDYIYAVYKARSFNKAAQELYISQSSLSTTIKRAEEKIGLPIFDRSAYPIQLTEFGKIYIDALEEVYALTENLKNYIYDVNHLAKGSLSIGAGNFFSSHLLPAAISAYKQKFPQIAVTLIEGRTLDLEQQLAKGNIQMLLTNGQFDTIQYDKTVLAKENLILAVPSHFFSEPPQRESLISPESLRYGDYADIPGVALQAFSKLPFIGLRPGNDTRLRTDKIFHSFDITPVWLLELDQSSTCFSFVCAGMGAGFIADTIVRSRGDLSGLLLYKIDHPATLRDIAIYTKHTSIMSRAVKEFIHILQAQL